jgi:hypothetical protein
VSPPCACHHRHGLDHAAHQPRTCSPSFPFNPLQTLASPPSSPRAAASLPPFFFLRKQNGRGYFPIAPSLLLRHPLDKPPPPKSPPCSPLQPRRRNRLKAP